MGLYDPLILIEIATKLVTQSLNPTTKSDKSDIMKWG